MLIIITINIVDIPINIITIPIIIIIISIIIVIVIFLLITLYLSLPINSREIKLVPSNLKARVLLLDYKSDLILLLLLLLIILLLFIVAITIINITKIIYLCIRHEAKISEIKEGKIISLGK